MKRWDRQGLGWWVLAAAVLGGAVVAGWRTLLGVSVGDVDPVGATVALVSLAVGVVTVRQGVWAQRWQETGVAEVAVRLTTAVLDEELDAWQQVLGDHDKPIGVRFDLRPAPGHSATGAEADGHLQGVADYYRRLRPGRLVITGAPGAGKTVLALQLMLRLLEQRAPEEPVPVRLSLASWNTDEDLGQWIARHLTRTYRLPAASARALVAARLVLPVLDGLDEMDADPEPGYGSRAGRAVRALNRAQQADGKLALVLTCRTRAYQALQEQRVWAQDAARVEIRPVAPDSARDFLTVRVADPDRWRPVFDALARDPGGPLAGGLSTPWRLTLAAIVYEQRQESTGAYPHDPTELLDPGLNTAEAVGEHLLALLIPAATALHNQRRGTSYTPHQVRAWLTELAAYLNTNAATGRSVGGRALSGTDIVLHELWPLAGPRLVRAVHATLTTAPLLTAIAVLLPHLPMHTLENRLSAAVLFFLLAGLAGVRAWGMIWPEAPRVELQRFRTPASWRFIAQRLAFGTALGLVIGLMVPVPAGIMADLAAAIPLGGMIGGAIGIAFGIMAVVAVPKGLGSVDPQDVVRGNLAFGVALWIMLGLMVTVPVGVAVGVTGGAAAEIAAVAAAGLVFGLASGLADGLAAVRYGVLLVCTRRWSRRQLPWRLGRFLHWCYGAGLLRIAGIAYQFRHRELQNHLAPPHP